MEQYYTEFLEEDNLAWITEMSGNFLLGISVPFYSWNFWRRERCVSYSTKNSGFNFRNVREFLGIKRTTSRSLSTFSFENFLRGICVPSDIWKFPANVMANSIRKLMDVRKANHSTDNSEISGRKIKRNRNFR